MIQTIDIVCHTHTDFGYTDYPLRSRALLKSYVGQAVAYAQQYAEFPADAQFHWTMETLIPVWDWWQDATAAERDALLAAVDRGQIEVMGLPFNITAFLNADEWAHMMRWIPRPLWERMHIRSAMQNDVNGLHRGGLRLAYDAGIRNIWIGPNTYNGVPPIPTPTLVNWQLDAHRTLRTWLNASYCDGYFLFQENWRQGPVPNSTDLRYRPPTPQDFFRSDEASVRRAHALCRQNLAAIEGVPAPDAQAARDGFTQNRVFGGYRGSVLAVSMTNQWRIDNDPPLYWLCDFVRTWNALGLQPRLRLRTATQAMDDVAAGWPDTPMLLRGEWTDWWANGTASSPMELAYSRRAKRLLQAANAPVFGDWTPEAKRCATEVLDQLCRYDEHTFGAWQSAAAPDSFEARSQRAEKDLFAYRALGAAQTLLALRAQPLEAGLHNALKLINPTPQPRTLRVELPRNCLRGDYTALRDPDSGALYPLRFERGVSNFLRPVSEADFGPENISRTFSDAAPAQTAVFRVHLPAMSAQTLQLCSPDNAPAPECSDPIPPYTLKTDACGWPVFLQVGGQTLLSGAVGAFHMLRPDGFAPRWTLRDIFDTDDSAERQRLYQAHTRLECADYAPAQQQIDGCTLCFTQSFTHAALAFGTRILRVDLCALTATLTVRFYRKSDLAPQIFYLALDAPLSGGTVHISNADGIFRPGLDQIPGSCLDYYAIDGWVHHETPQQRWMVYSRDAALVCFGAPSQPARRTTLAENTHQMFFQLFDNTWDTNFSANAFGTMEFTFDIAHGVALDACNETAQALAAEPVVIVRTGFDAPSCP